MVRLCIAVACIQHSVRVCKEPSAALRAAAVLRLFKLFILAAAAARAASVDYLIRINYFLFVQTSAAPRRPRPTALLGSNVIYSSTTV